jgi:hypothetical protein
MSWFGGGADPEQAAMLRELLANQRRIEAKLDRLLVAFDLADADTTGPVGGPHGLPDADRAIIREYMATGRKIEAIKHLKDRTNLGLAEAKNAVERGEY